MIVWWGIRKWSYYMHHPRGSLGNLYKWMFRLGPLEIRKRKI
jgi:hypothetical protein